MDISRSELFLGTKGETISGPSYKGVTQITGGKMTVNILAEHKEEDYFRVQRQLTSAVLDILAKEGIPTA